MVNANVSEELAASFLRI